MILSFVLAVKISKPFSAHRLATFRASSPSAIDTPIIKPRPDTPVTPGILVDHSSAKGHRRALERADSLMRKSVEASEKASYYASRASSAACNGAISSDDPEAMDKLKAELAALQAEQEQDKALNAYYRKHKTMKGFEGISDEEAEEADAELSKMREAIRRPVHYDTYNVCATFRAISLWFAV